MTESKSKPFRPSGIVRGLFTLISAVCVGLGTLAIVTEELTISTRRSGLVTLESEQAVEMGLMLVVLGLIPLVIWARTPRQAKTWLALCVFAFGALLVRMLA